MNNTGLAGKKSIPISNNAVDVFDISKHSKRATIKLNVSLIHLPTPKEIFGVMIKNKTFYDIGLEKGFVAVVFPMEIERGELAAVEETKTSSVTIGFYEYDKEVKKICLADLDMEVKTFDKKKHSILGKVIGYISPTNDLTKSYTVTPIEINVFDWIELNESF